LLYKSITRLLNGVEMPRREWPGGSISSSADLP
jgi:hypothetical protein